MSIISISHRDPPPAPAALTSESLYLTDGSCLYRIATEEPATPGFVWLEDCHSLELLLAQDHELEALRAVPTGG